MTERKGITAAGIACGLVLCSAGLATAEVIEILELSEFAGDWAFSPTEFGDEWSHGDSQTIALSPDDVPAGLLLGLELRIIGVTASNKILIAHCDPSEPSSCLDTGAGTWVKFDMKAVFEAEAIAIAEINNVGPFESFEGDALDLSFLQAGTSCLTLTALMQDSVCPGGRICRISGSGSLSVTAVELAFTVDDSLFAAAAERPSAPAACPEPSIGLGGYVSLVALGALGAIRRRRGA